MQLFFQGMIAPALLVGGFGLLFGLCLTYAARKFAVEEDPKIDEIAGLLPGADCGSCGFPGCRGYADALVKDPQKLGACNAVSADNLARIAALLGTDTVAKEAVSVRLTCQGDCVNAKAKYAYEGMASCRNAARLGGGAKACFYGCLGLGDCVSICPNHAISLNNGIAVVNQELCSGCGTCVSACPKELYTLIPKTAAVFLSCKTQEKGATAKKQCMTACLGCGLCAKVCESGAITMENNLPVLDYAKCTGCLACAEKCPTGALVRVE